MQQKNYRLLRFLQSGLGILGWLCVIGSVVIFCGTTALGFASGSSDAALASLPISFGLALSVFTVGVGYLISAQLIEVFVDMASNTQRTAYLLEHMINHWPAGTSPMPLPSSVAAQLPSTPPAT